MSSYVKVSHWKEAFEALEGPEICILAGGTDIYATEDFPRKNSILLDITDISEARGIEISDEGVWIGALTSWREIAAAELPPYMRALQQAAVVIGGRQIQNAGTIGGNICNASPAADGVPPLMALGAKVEIRSAEAVRRVTIGDFIRGRRQTDLQAGEIVSRIHIPHAEGTQLSEFMKIGTRAYLVISPVMVAGATAVDKDGIIMDCRLSVGACSEVASRLPFVEARLIGQPCSKLLDIEIRDQDFSHLSPLDDARGSAEYRLSAAKELTKRLLEKLGGQHV